MNSTVEPEVVDEQLRSYLEEYGLLEPNQSASWKIELSKLSGRGVIAQRDIKRGELVYRDRALVIGPRCYSKYLPMCVSCYKRGCALFACDRGCGLPVCSDACQDSPAHLERECAYLRELQPSCPETQWSNEILQAVVPVRSLFLPDLLKQICYSLQHNQPPQKAREVDLLKKNVKNQPKPEDEDFMRRICNAMDTNAFETAVLQGSESTSLRALFPLGALTNHQCVPNTRHLVDDTGHLFVYATKDIAKGQEITMTYTDLLWDTTMRRSFLKATKQFSCQCARCSDHTEFNSLLGALYCATATCPGHLMPDVPLSFTTNWTCNECGLRIKNKQIMAIRAGILAATEEVLYDSPRKMLQFIKRELSILVPKTNYFMIDMMFRIISLFGRVEDLTWEDLTEDELDTKIEYCKDTIKMLDQLNCGDCTKKGLILFELYRSNVEKNKRTTCVEEKIKDKSEDSVNEKILLEAVEILKNDVAAPCDYLKLYSTLTSKQ